MLIRSKTIIPDTINFMFCVSNGATEVVMELLKLDHICSKETIDYAFKSGPYEIAKKVSEFYNPESPNVAKLSDLVLKDQAKRLKLYIDYGSYDLTTIVNDFISEAIFINAKECLKVLLSYDEADPAANDNAELISACDSNHTEIVQILLKDRRVNPNVALEQKELFSKEIVQLRLDDDRVKKESYQ